MARPLWKGAINFGLVNIPVEMISAVHEKTVHFHMLSKDGTCRLRRKLYCPENDKEYDFGQTARGIEVAPDEYVIVDEREINRLKPEKGKSMDVQQFVPQSAIDPVFYDRTYYLRPTEEAIRPYALFVEALAHAQKCAIAQFVMREKQLIAVVRVLGEGLVLHTLHYADEVDHLDQLLPSKVKSTKLRPNELAMANELIKSMSTQLDIEAFHDEYRERLEQLIQSKIEGKEMVKPFDDYEEPAPRVSSLMDALKKSLSRVRTQETTQSAHLHSRRARASRSRTRQRRQAA